MDDTEWLAILAMGGLFLAAQFIALAAIHPFQAAGVQAFENPDDPANILQIVLVVVVFTAVILFIARYRQNIIKYIILFVFFFSLLYIFEAFLLVLTSHGLASTVGAFALAVGGIILLLLHPEWYVVDGIGVLMAGGIIAIFGTSLSIPLVIALLVILAVYDAISVYKTKHMLSLADAVVGENLPLLMVVPKKQGYSFLEQAELGKKRDALFMGLGDAIIPGILGAAAYLAAGLTVAVVTILGTLAGYFYLMRLAATGNPQAGLPCLNGGALAGYLLASLAVHGSIIGF
ncbi:MAG: presenilin family intramembrane aspartyl protease PSH [Thermoplasmatota archaeon]